MRTKNRISNSLVDEWVPRGFAVVHSEAPGTGLSQGCPTVGGSPRNCAPKAVIDWLNGRAKGYTTPDRRPTKCSATVAHRQGRHDRHVVQRHAAGRGRDHRRRGTRGDHPGGAQHLVLPLLSLATAWCGTRAATSARTSTSCTTSFTAAIRRSAPTATRTCRDGRWPTGQRPHHRRLQQLLGRARSRAQGGGIQRGDADGARLQRLERDARASASASSEIIKKNKVPLQQFYPSGWPWRQSADAADEPLVHALPLRRRQRRRAGPEGLDRARGRADAVADAVRRLSESRCQAGGARARRGRTHRGCPHPGRPRRRARDARRQRRVQRRGARQGHGLAESAAVRHARPERTGAPVRHGADPHSPREQQAGRESVGVAGGAAVDRARQQHHGRHQPRLGRPAEPRLTQEGWRLSVV